MNIKVDSRKVKNNDTFIAIRGISSDGHSYIEKAIENGATKIIAEYGSYSVETQIVDNTKDYLIKYLKDNYYNEIKDIKIIGITGTNGKTTSSYLVYQLLNNLNVKTAYIGTIGFYLEDKKQELINTTPDILDLYEMFLECKDKFVEVIVMEVSSHALEENRVEGIEFDIACFTNLTQDHLDFHKTMENYKFAKIKLFKKLRNKKIAIINKDDPSYFDFILNENTNITYGIDKSDYQILDYKLYMNKVEFILKDIKIELPLPGKYNIYNFINAFIIAKELGFSDEEILTQTKKLKSPEGRIDLIEYKNSYVIVDYAHTPDALYNIINNVNEYKKNKVITIVGCGGDRDKTKRPIMGDISTKLSDYVIFTNDNPRTEDPKEIISDITRDLNIDNFEIIMDRKSAIIRGIELLEDEDILLILGKGHENYQILGKEKIHFSDKEIVLEYKMSNE